MAGYTCIVTDKWIAICDTTLLSETFGETLKAVAKQTIKLTLIYSCMH